MTQVITFASPKGGVGKSSLCINTAAYFFASNYSVVVIDTDPQMSSYDWISESDDPLLKHITAFHISSEQEIAHFIGETDSDIVCLDMEGNLYNSMGFCLAIADLVVVPCRPSRDDLVGLAWVKKLSEAAFADHPDSNARVVALMNGIDQNSDVFSHVKRQITQDGMEVFNNFLSQSTEIAESNINRVSALNILGKSSKEIVRIGQEIGIYLEGQDN
jgi:chromosome partitioning protein